MTSRRLSRKEFLGIGAGAAAGVALAGSGMGTLLSREAGAVTSFLPYQVGLPVPPVVKPVPGPGGVYQLSISADQSTQAMHPKLPSVKVWGYNGGPKGGGYLGPTIEVQKGQSTTVKFTNNLPTTHLLPVTTSLVPDGTDTPRILTHLHGGFVSGNDDGNPYATTTLFFKGKTQTVTYTPQPRATTLWYHDHAMGMTRLNVYAGLAGFFLVRDAFDTGKEPNPIGIPGGAYEVPIVIQDKSFSGGQIFYTDDPPEWEPEFFGNTPVINGAVQPYLTVEPRMYRFRLLNGSQSRFYNLELAIGDTSAGPFYQIGSEGGMFDKPVQTSRILLLPAERADVIVDFGGLAGQNVELKNRSLPAGVVSPAEPNISSLMQFQVRGTASTPRPTSIPATLPGSKPNLGAPLKTRYITLEEVLDPVSGDPLWLQMNGDRFGAPVKETPKAGTVEDWAFVNISADTHPIHMHLTNFKVLGRQRLDGLRYDTALKAARDGQGAYKLLDNKTLDPTDFLIPGTFKSSAANEKGWKDTVAANPNQVTWIRQRFDLPSRAKAPQKYVYHCHILEHEENDMMRPYEVV